MANLSYADIHAALDSVSKPHLATDAAAAWQRIQDEFARASMVAAECETFRTIAIEQASRIAQLEADNAILAASAHTLARRLEASARG